MGYYAASLMDGPEVTINGNAGWALGENQMSGKIVISKDAGASVASSIRGGEIFVGGNAGARAGISMKGGSLLIRGNAGFMAGFMMQKSFAPKVPCFAKSPFDKLRANGFSYLRSW